MVKLEVAREKAWDLIKIAKAHGVNPKMMPSASASQESQDSSLIDHTLQNSISSHDVAGDNSIASWRTTEQYAPPEPPSGYTAKTIQSANKDLVSAA